MQSMICLSDVGMLIMEFDHKAEGILSAIADFFNSVIYNRALPGTYGSSSFQLLYSVLFKSIRCQASSVTVHPDRNRFKGRMQTLR